MKVARPQLAGTVIQVEKQGSNSAWVAAGQITVPPGAIGGTGSVVITGDVSSLLPIGTFVRVRAVNGTRTSNYSLPDDVNKIFPHTTEEDSGDFGGVSGL